jgi:protoheme IX farnesyltransferase
MQTVVETKLSVSRRLAAFFHLCKPRVNSLIVFTAMIGMFLATPGFPPLLRFAVASIGIALVAFAAAALNCLVERTIDARMARTRWPEFDTFRAHFWVTPSSGAGFRAADRQTPRYMDC